MMHFSRRRFLAAGSAATLIGVAARAQADERSAMAEKFADLKPMTGGLPAFPADVHADRQRRLREALAAAGVGACLLGPTLNLRYFTGASWGVSERLFCCLVFADGDPLWIAPAFEALRAQETIPAGQELRTWEEYEDPHRLVLDVLKQRKVRARHALAVDSHLRAVHALRLTALADAGDVIDGLPVTAAVRACKTAPELARIRRACEITQTAIEQVRQRVLAPGVTEMVVSAAMHAAMQRLGLSSTWCLALVGKNAAFPHGTRERLPLAAGQMVLIDTGGELEGYQSDITRTFVVGADPSSRQQEVYGLVWAAQAAAIATAKPGVRCEAVDAAARRVIVDGGFGPDHRFFSHRLGHGIGLEGHEDPYFCRGNSTPLAPGMTLSDEPGIYIPGELGVRLEDIVVITDTGCEALGTLPEKTLPRA